MKSSHLQAIVACALFAGVFATPAFGQNQGVIARGDCPRTMRTMAHTHTPAPAPMTYRPVAELERYIASLQAAAPAAAEPRERAPAKRAKRLPRPF